MQEQMLGRVLVLYIVCTEAKVPKLITEMHDEICFDKTELNIIKNFPSEKDHTSLRWGRIDQICIP
jgi:hypothetical protein